MLARLVPLLAGLTACAAVPPLPPPPPEVPLATWESPPAAGTEALATSDVKEGPTAPTPALAKTAGAPRTEAPASAGPFAPPAKTAASPIPGGQTCLDALAARHVAFRASKPVVGIATPVVLTGPLEGIEFYASDRRPFLADCRLVLALDEVAPELVRLGVTRVRFSGAYVYKLTRPGRMSMHAYGLAVDLHAFRIDGKLLEVKKGFARGRGKLCRSGMPVLNLLACRVREHGLFKEQLGPDDNSAHSDHFHLALKPLPGELAQHLPMPPSPRARHRKSHVRARRHGAPRRHSAPRRAAP